LEKTGVAELIDELRMPAGLPVAKLLNQRNPSQTVDETLRAFTRFFEQGLLSWRGRD
jgi:hypothetical protein